MNYTQAFLLVIAFFVIAALYYVYNQILWFIVAKPYTKGDFSLCIKKIDKLSKFFGVYKRQKMYVYKSSCAILLGDDDLFIKTINKINLKSHTYGPYYYYYNMALALKYDDFTKAEKLYGDLTSKYQVEQELDMITPLAILMAHKGDKKAFKKLKTLKREGHIDITFSKVVDKFIQKNN